MPKNTQKKSKGTHKSHAVQKTPGIVAGVSAFLQRTAQGRFGAVVSNLAKYTRSGVVTMGSAAWYIVVTAMVIVFPIRRAVEMDALMEEERMRQEQRYNPDAVLPSVPGMYNAGAGASSVPITAHH